MTGFAKDDHGSLETSQASISLLAKQPDIKYIKKAKVREILSGTMRGQKTLGELRGCSRCPPPRCMFIFTRCFDT